LREYGIDLVQEVKTSIATGKFNISLRKFINLLTGLSSDSIYRVWIQNAEEEEKKTINFEEMTDEQMDLFAQAQGWEFDTSVSSHDPLSDEIDF